jgi:hypothetical protein
MLDIDLCIAVYLIFPSVVNLCCDSTNIFMKDHFLIKQEYVRSSWCSMHQICLSPRSPNFLNLRLLSCTSSLRMQCTCNNLQFDDTPEYFKTFLNVLMNIKFGLIFFTGNKLLKIHINEVIFILHHMRPPLWSSGQSSYREGQFLRLCQHTWIMGRHHEWRRAMG